jgi:hypothetical protein
MHTPTQKVTLRAGLADIVITALPAHKTSRPVGTEQIQRANTALFAGSDICDRSVNAGSDVAERGQSPTKIHGNVWQR